MKFKKGQTVRVYLTGCGYTTSEDTEIVVRVSKGMVYTDGTETPYCAETGEWIDNRYSPLFRRIKPDDTK